MKTQEVGVLVRGKEVTGTISVKLSNRILRSGTPIYNSNYFQIGIAMVTKTFKDGLTGRTKLALQINLNGTRRAYFVGQVFSDSREGWLKLSPVKR